MDAWTLVWPRAWRDAWWDAWRGFSAWRLIRGRAVRLMPGSTAVVALALVGLAGCASPPPQAPVAALLQDQRFASAAEPIDPAAVMAPSPEMQRFVRERLAGAGRQRDARQQLLEALYTRGELRLDYDAGLTRTAAQAFEAKAGNCLSLSLMTAAFARELGLPVQFRHVYMEEQWSRVGDLQVLAGHINIALQRRSTEFKVLGDEAQSLVVDFLPGVDIRRQRSITLDERSVVAMYLNNRAAELLADGEVARAYWWARAALLHDARHLNALNTLGVIYRRHGDAEAARRSFEQLLRLEPGNTQAMANLIPLLEAAGQASEAQALSERLAQLQPHPPFRFFDLGRQAMREGDYRRARELFTKEVERSAYNHEFHFWLALANMGLGRWDEVRQALTQAQEHSPGAAERALYAAKLASLRAGQR